MSTNSVLVLLLAVLLPAAVQSCGLCESDSPIPRDDVIRNSFFSDGNPEVYTAMVLAATCNCMPGNDTDSQFLNCQHYQLDFSASAINATIFTRGQCQAETRHDYNVYTTPPCDQLESSLRTWGLQVEGPALTDGDITNLALDNRCSLSCPFNLRESGALPEQPCVYTVKVLEVFKGTYSVEDVIEEVAGPDVSCGDASGRVLHISASYVAGIGEDSSCSPIPQWTELREYSDQDVDFLRNLTDSLVTPVGGGGGSALLPSLLVLLSTCLATLH